MNEEKRTALTGIRRVRLRDPNFGFSRKYAAALADALITEGVELSASIDDKREAASKPLLMRSVPSTVEIELTNRPLHAIHSSHAPQQHLDALLAGFLMARAMLAKSHDALKPRSGSSRALDPEENSISSRWGQAGG